MDKVSCYQLKHYNFFIPTFAFSSSFLVAIQKKGTFLLIYYVDIWTHIIMGVLQAIVWVGRHVFYANKSDLSDCPVAKAVGVKT